MHGQNYILGVAGRKGCGKSTWVTERVREMERIAIIDTLGEYSHIFPPYPEPLETQVHFLASQKEKLQASFLLPPEHMSTAFNFLCRAAYMNGALTLVIEEVDYFSKPTWNEPGLDLLIRYGRHRNVNVIYTVRNLVETSRRLTAQTDAFVIFSITEPTYLNEIEERLGEEAATTVANLSEHDFTIIETVKKESGIVNGEVDNTQL